MRTPIPEIIRTAGVRWQTEDDNKESKQLVGLEDYQVRTWKPWHRYTACCLLPAACSPTPSSPPCVPATRHPCHSIRRLAAGVRRETS
ncbi:hypothetical protein ACGFX8_30715 [Streptomyces sp. NPDC048362]|uniref:hypothetical protein n=1 Tax=Streptomyces sp. NPDC048362 TaxID=3365539 RepID=UPI00372034B4